MARLFIGLRVRKARGSLDVGNTGVITEFDHRRGIKWDTCVQWDNAGPCADGEIALAGEEVWVAGDQLEPILPSGHTACDEEFKRDLDRLLQREGIAA